MPQKYIIHFLAMYFIITSTGGVSIGFLLALPEERLEVDSICARNASAR